MNRFFWFFVRAMIGGIFIYSGFTKLIEPIENFRYLLNEYTVFPKALVPAITIVFPWLEVVLGVFLITGYLTRFSALVLTGFSFGFVFVLVLSRWILGIWPDSCGCFGESGLKITVPQILMIDTINVLLGFQLFRMREHWLTLDRWLCGSGRLARKQAP
ncbi:MAG: DoxX family protein [Candidatus Omnitrophota bacterium]